MQGPINRQFPIYLVLDCSGAMSGELIAAVRAGLSQLIADLKADPNASEIVSVSVIAFANSARQIVPLSEVAEFPEVILEAAGARALGEALQRLEETIDREVRNPSPIQQADWRPLAFLTLHGPPTDDWETAAKNLRTKTPQGNKAYANIVGCATGSSAAAEILRGITATVVELDDDPHRGLKLFFEWISTAITTASASLCGGATTVTLPEPPRSLPIVP